MKYFALIQELDHLKFKRSSGDPAKNPGAKKATASD